MCADDMCSNSGCGNERCMRTCTDCRSSFCPEHIYDCASCSEATCHDCGHEAAGLIYCDDCAVLCEVCDAATSPTGRVVCEDCGETVCRSCAVGRVCKPCLAARECEGDDDFDADEVVEQSSGDQENPMSPVGTPEGDVE